MKNNPRIALLLGCLLAFTSTAKAESAAKGPIDVYLLGGQSNMSGQGRISDIPAGEEMVEGVLYYHSATVKGSSAPNTLHTNVTPAGANKNAFGPEIGFANRIKQLRPGASMAIIKYSVVGTSLITDWRPGANAADTANWGPQFAGFVKTVNGGLAALRDAGYQPRIVGMLWQQGEQDAKDGWDCRTNPPKALAGET
ncbi:MAG: sialate O-acetylesterase, partial [Kiritimatiellales bacterium]|nr:sialate O-acetylesterase [Kiritimatiellales bacterium]